MTLALNYNSGAIAINSGSTGNPDTGTSASFTPPVGAVVFATACWNDDASPPNTGLSISNTGGGLSAWTLIRNEAHGNLAPDGGTISVWYAVVTSSVATTVTVQWTPGRQRSVQESIFTIHVWTGAATNQSGAANAGGQSTAFSPSTPQGLGLTTTAANSQMVLAVMDRDGTTVWAPTDGSPNAAFNGTFNSDCLIAYKTAVVSSPGATTITVQETGTGATVGRLPTWVAYEILADNGATITGYPLLENGTDRFLLEGSSGLLTFEGGAGTTYVYRGPTAWSTRYKGSRSDAALYKGTRTLHP